MGDDTEAPKVAAGDADEPPDARRTLPRHLWERPANRLYWERPTAWLLGTQMTTSLRDIVLSSVYECDPRDWMYAGEPVDLHDQIEPATQDEPEGAWIDFLSDSGDSPRLVYRLAYLLQQEALEVVDKDGAPITSASGAVRRLPRGRALIFGGDTAYPVADQETLVSRVRAPFLWAQADLRAEHKLVDGRKVTLLGVPGNHDYYNIMHGYVRQFRAGRSDPPTDARPRFETFDIPGYELAQQASYFAVRLPFDWQLWGLDIEMEKKDADGEAYYLDEGQRTYFRARAKDVTKDNEPIVDRIVVTSQPAVVYHGPSKRAGSLQAIFRSLGQEPSFLDAGVLPGDRVRLDLSGDVHVYERYWGSDGGCCARGTAESWGSVKDTPTGNEVTPHRATEQRSNYASVVSGLGGAFHHPSQVRKPESQQHAPRRAWPSSSESAAVIGKLLIRPRKVFQAGAVGVAGAVVAAFCLWLAYFAEDRLNLLDVPFAFPRASVDLEARGYHLLLVASIFGSLILFGGIVAFAMWWSRRLARPMLSKDELPLASWGGLTYRAIHNKHVFWCLRWFGSDRRLTWRALLTAPAWLFVLVPAIFGLPYALYSCRHLGYASDGFGPLYVLVIVLLLGMGALGVFVGGSGHPPLRRLLFGVFGMVTGALILWTPYAWTLVVIGNPWPWALCFFGFWFIRKLMIQIRFLEAGTRWRRAMSFVSFVALAALFVTVPLLAIPLDAPLDGYADRPFGGYFACLWVGWYFFVCLQWNAHGNEAGGAARVAEYAQFLRIKLTPGRAEVFVISAEGPKPATRTWSWRKPRTWWTFDRPERWADRPITPRLIDHFVVSRPVKPSPVTATETDHR